MNATLGRTAFSVGDHPYTWQDVVLAAIVRGDWMAMEQQARLGLALVQWADESDNSPTEPDVDAAGEEFRYERELVTAEEMEAWLERCGLTIEEWMDYIERAVLRRRFAECPDEVDEDAVEGDEIRACVLAEAICDGELARFADTLAARAAVAARAAEESATEGAPLSSGDLETVVERALRTLSDSGLDIPAEDCRERMAELARQEQVFRGASRARLTDDAIRAQVEAHRLDWIRLEVREIAFADEAAAREAALCIREDGATLESVANDAHAPVREGRYYLDETDPETRPMLLSAGPDELVGPLSLSDGFHLLLVREKIMPSDQDADIRRRAEETLVSSLSEREAQSRVRWHERL